MVWVNLKCGIEHKMELDISQIMLTLAVGGFSGWIGWIILPWRSYNQFRHKLCAEIWKDRYINEEQYRNILQKLMPDYVISVMIYKYINTYTYSDLVSFMDTGSSEYIDNTDASGDLVVNENLEVEGKHKTVDVDDPYLMYLTKFYQLFPSYVCIYLRALWYYCRNRKKIRGYTESTKNITTSLSLFKDNPVAKYKKSK